VDTARFNPELAAALHAKYDLDPGLPIILYAGRVDADKRVDRVMDLASRIGQGNRR
jgi:hypothetical protein